MNRTAYLTTGLAIKTLSSLSRADISLHGEENLPDGPVIFVINHFTRIETLLLPYHINKLTDKAVWSLAHGDLFSGGLAKFFDLVGVLSTANPNRDKVIVKTLLTGEADWIIFPEGSMIKTKKIVNDGDFMITDPKGMRKPHTGAAALALRTELFRRCLLGRDRADQPTCERMLAELDIASLDMVGAKPCAIVPVNLTYYPLRARENIASTLAARMVRDLPERMVEEIMTEGTMLLEGVDLDIRFGAPIDPLPWLEGPEIEAALTDAGAESFFSTSPLRNLLRERAHSIMQRYMGAIYSMTTINHEHLFASFLRLYPFTRIREHDLRRRVFLIASMITETQEHKFYLHKSLQESQIHLLTDDRYAKFDNFLQLALEKGVLHRDGETLVLDRSKLSAAISFHRGRIDNPIEIIANEVEPLPNLYALIKRLTWPPGFVFRPLLVHYLQQRELIRYRKECAAIGLENGQERKILGMPFLLPGHTRRTGVLLIHSYLALPDEVRVLAQRLNRAGFWIYAVRLPGHGTSSADLATKSFEQWLEAAETGYAILRTLCAKVLIGGISVGASIALNLTARIPEVAGVFAICPPYRLQDFSTRFMPAIDVWKRMLQRLKGSTLTDHFFEFHSENPHINYPMNPYSGIREVDLLLDHTRERLDRITQPALIIQAEKDSVIDPKSARSVYDQIGSRQKEFDLVSVKRYALLNGSHTEHLHSNLLAFVREVQAAGDAPSGSAD